MIARILLLGTLIFLSSCTFGLLGSGAPSGPAIVGGGIGAVGGGAAGALVGGGLGAAAGGVKGALVGKGVGAVVGGVGGTVVGAVPGAVVGGVLGKLVLGPKGLILGAGLGGVVGGVVGLAGGGVLGAGVGAVGGGVKGAVKGGIKGAAVGAPVGALGGAAVGSVLGGVAGEVIARSRNTVQNWRCQSAPIAGRAKITAVGDGSIDLGPNLRVRFANCTYLSPGKGRKSFAVGDTVSYGIWNDGNTYWAQYVSTDGSFPSFPVSNGALQPGQLNGYIVIPGVGETAKIQFSTSPPKGTVKVSASGQAAPGQGRSQISVEANGQAN